ncbi:MAG: hypothetical protein ACQZ3M_05360 [cyanobacterium endosymbiont of Rhopalodia fuxianensis]
MLRKKTFRKLLVGFYYLYSMLKEELQSCHNYLAVGQIYFSGLNCQQFLENYLVSYIERI